MSSSEFDNAPRCCGASFHIQFQQNTGHVFLYRFWSYAEYYSDFIISLTPNKPRHDSGLRFTEANST